MNNPIIDAIVFYDIFGKAGFDACLDTYLRLRLHPQAGLR
jgi:hypothetical protein